MDRKWPQLWWISLKGVGLQTTSKWNLYVSDFQMYEFLGSLWTPTYSSQQGFVNLHLGWIMLATFCRRTYFQKCQFLGYPVIPTLIMYSDTCER